MENKSNPIDKIKVLENSVNELKSIISQFIKKKSNNFKKMDLFNFNKKKNQTNTIDDTDLSCQPVIIDSIDIQDIRTRINTLETKLNIFIENLEIKNEMNQEQYESLKSAVEEIVIEIKREKNERLTDIQNIKNDINNGIILIDE
jgi:hypothetical protein